MSETPMSPTLPPRARHVMRLAVEALASACLCQPWNTDREHRENDRHETHSTLPHKPGRETSGTYLPGIS